MWTRIGNLFKIDSGEAFKKNDYSDQGLRLFQIANVGFGYTVWDQEHFLPEKFAKSHPDLLLAPGEIVLALNRPILGNFLKVAKLSSDDMPAILYQRVGRLRPLVPEISSYSFLFAQSRLMFKEVEKRLQGSDQPYLNTSLVPNIPVPLPPLEEQQEIVRRVEQLFKLADAIEKRVAAATLRAEKLTQASSCKGVSGRVGFRPKRNWPGVKGGIMSRLQFCLRELRGRGRRRQRRSRRGGRG